MKHSQRSQQDRFAFTPMGEAMCAHISYIPAASEGKPRKMRRLQRFCSGLLVLLLSSLLPIASLPQAYAAPPFTTNPGSDWVVNRPRPYRVKANVYACRVATYSLGVTRTMDIVWGNFGIAAGPRNALIDAAEQYAEDACGTSPKVALQSQEKLIAASKNLVQAYATKAGVNVTVAGEVLNDLQLSLLSQAMSCGNMATVGSYLRGGAVGGSINIVGQPVTGSSFTVAPLGPTFSCGGSGGGGGGGGGVGGLPWSMSPGAFAGCMASANKLSNSCPLTDPQG